MHAALIDDRNAIYGALAKLGVLRDEKLVPGDSRPPFNWRDLSTRRKLSPLVLAALASVIVLAADRGTTVAKRFLEDLNAGLRDSSLFDADVRLGQLGQMSRVDAVTELRKLSVRYAGIHCRIGRNGVTPKDPQHARNGLRAQIDTECDFTDQAGVTATRRFPLEIEAGPDVTGNLLISGLWQPEEAWLWQPRPR